jgi:hypothetical protein
MRAGYDRPGYDRVSSDTRRAPIPDVPIVHRTVTPKPFDNGPKVVIIAVFALLLFLGVAVGFLFGPSQPGTSSLVVPLEVAQDGR